MFVIPLSVWLIGTGVVTVLSAIFAFVVSGATFISNLISHPLLTLSAALRTLCKAATALMLLVAVVAEFATKFHAHSAWVLALIPGVLAALCQILHEFLLRRFEVREAVRIERQLRESRIKAGLDPDSGEALTDAPSPRQQPIQVQIVPVKAYYVQPNGAATGEQTPPHAASRANHVFRHHRWWSSRSTPYHRYHHPRGRRSARGPMKDHQGWFAYAQWLRFRCLFFERN